MMNGERATGSFGRYVGGEMSEVLVHLGHKGQVCCLWKRALLIQQREQANWFPQKHIQERLVVLKGHTLNQTYPLNLIFTLFQ